MKIYKQSKGLILTLVESDTATIEVNDSEREIIIKPVWKWMLE